MIIANHLLLFKKIFKTVDIVWLIKNSINAFIF